MLKRPGDALARLLQRFDVDRAVLFGLALRGWSVLSGVGTALLIASRFSPAIQGYHFTFIGLMSLQVFLELGLGSVLVSFASHEWSALRLEEGRVRGETQAMSRLASLTRFSLKWFAVAGVVLVLVLMGAGCVFLGGGDEAGISWQGPWLLLSVATGLSLCLTPFVSILTGCNQVEQINRFRVQQSFLNTLTMWGCMWMGANLWTLPVATLVGVACTLYLVAVRYGEFFQGLRLVHCQQVIAWTTEILPLQWRVAVSSLCAVLATQVFTPVLFHYRGATVAGQMGMTWMAFNALLDVAMTWVNVKLPQFGMYVARRDFEALDRAALRAARTALLVLSAGVFAFVGGVLFLQWAGSRLAGRLLDPTSTAILAVGVLGNALVSIMVLYLRVHKREPYLWMSVLGAVTVPPMALILGRAYGAQGMVAGWTGLVYAGLIPNVLIFLRCRKEWHAPVEPGTTDLAQPVAQENA